MRRYPVSVWPALGVFTALLLATGCSSAPEVNTEGQPGTETGGLGSLEQNAIYAMGLNYAEELERIGYSPEQIAIAQRALRDAAANGFVEIPPIPEELESDAEREAYGKGLTFANNAIRLELNAEETDSLITAMDEGLAGTAQIELDQYRWLIPRLANRREIEAQRRVEEASIAYLEEAAAEPGAIVTDSGLIYQEVREGTGASPTAADTVRVNYHGTLVDGTVFDSSYDRGEVFQVGLGAVISCWTEGIQMMKVGGEARLVCPAEIAYSNVGQGDIPPNATLIFDVELLDFF